LARRRLILHHDAMTNRANPVLMVMVWQSRGLDGRDPVRIRIGG
jgi:hypothetical protein